VQRQRQRKANAERADERGRDRATGQRLGAAAEKHHQKPKPTLQSVDSPARVMTLVG
jgi:hypothetical protein